MSTDRFKSFRNTVQLKLGNFFGKPSRPEKSGGVNLNLQAAIFTEQRAAKLAAENDPRRVQIMQSLVEKLWTRYQRLGNFADLETALQNCQQLLEEISSSHPEKPRILIKSAVCFRDRYIRNGDPRDIQAAIENGQAALDLAKEDQDKVHATVCLARCFKACYQRLKESGDINTAMQKYQAVLENLTTSNLQTEKPQVLFELATCFADRFDRSRELSDLQEAIEKATAALHLTPVEAVNRVQIQRGLAWAFQKRSERLGTVDDLNTAIQKYQEILGQIPTDHPECGRLLFDLATSLGDRFKILGELDDLYAAVNNAEKALSVIPMGHPYQVNVRRGLAWCYQESFRRTGNLEHLQIAIDGYKEILEQIPINNNAERAMIRWNLATSLADRYRRLTDLMDLEAVAINCQAALRLIPSGDSRSMQILHRLAWYSHTRYQRLGDMKDLETSIQRYEEVLDQILPDYQRATTLFNLAAAFRDRYERSRDLENLNSAMDKSQMALDLMPSDRRLDRADMLKGSASYHHTKYEKLGNLQDLEIAIQRYQQSLDLSPKDTQADGLEGLAICFRDRYRKAGDPSDLADAMQKFQEAIKFLPENHPYKAPGQQGLASCFCEQYKRHGKSKDLKSARDLYTSSFRASTLTNPQKSWNAALEWAVFADEHKPEYSLSAYLAAFQLLPNILWIGNTISTRHDIMQHLNIGAVTANAAKAFVQLSKAGTSVEIIEQGVATVFQQMLQLRPEVDTLSGQLAQEFQRLSMELFDGTSNDLQRIAVQRNTLLDEIRAKRGHQYFLLPKPYDALCQVARGGPVIILNSHQISCAAIIILDTTSRQPVSVTFPGVTADLLKAKQNSLRELVGRCNVRYRGQSAPETRLQGGREGTLFRTVHEQFADLLQWLWRHVVDPVYKVLASHLGV